MLRSDLITAVANVDDNDNVRLVCQTQLFWPIKAAKDGLQSLDFEAWILKLRSFVCPRKCSIEMSVLKQVKPD